MEPILQALDAEWSEVASSPEARRALIRWANDHEQLEGLHDLDDVLRCRRDPLRCHQVLHVLAVLAPTDVLAARTLLQTLLPGIVRMVGTIGHSDPDAPDELVALAWDRIRSYPASRSGSVAANVVLDVRKRYLQQFGSDGIVPLHLIGDPIATDRTTEDDVLAILLIEEIEAAQRDGHLSAAVLDVIMRTRLGGERLKDVAKDHGVPTKVLCQRRWRAERRLRALPLVG